MKKNILIGLLICALCGVTALNLFKVKASGSTILDYSTVDGNVLRIGSGNCFIYLNMATNNIELVGDTLDVHSFNNDGNYSLIKIRGSQVIIGDTEWNANGTTVTVNDPASVVEFSRPITAPTP